MIILIFNISKEKGLFAIAHLNSVSFLTESVFRIIRVLIYLRIHWVQPTEYKEQEGRERNKCNM